jgi:hypothetical protein
MRRAIKRGDTPLMKARLFDANGEPVDLADTIVEFYAKSEETGEIKVNAGAGSGTANGLLSYRLTSEDTDAVGTYLC